MAIHWSQKLRVEIAALNEVLRAMTDEELQTVSERIASDDGVFLKEEVLEIIQRRLNARKIQKQLLRS